MLTISFRPHDAGVDHDHDHADDSATARPDHTRLLHTLGLSSTRMDLPASTPAEDLRALLTRANADPHVLGLHVAGRLPAHLAQIHDDMMGPKNLDAPTWDASLTAQAAMRIIQPFLGRDVVTAVVGTDTRLGTEMTGLLRGANTMPITLDRGRDLRIVREVDVIVSTDPSLAADLRSNIRRTTSLVVHACGSGPARSSTEDNPQAVLADRASIAAIEAAVFSESVARTLFASALPSWRYLVVGPSGRLTSAMTDVHNTLDAARLTSPEVDGQPSQRGHEHR
ncbi:hypothetical protein AD006_29315 (plasmid) [Pseudonocardia sp. EC080610-09]|uniref:hypothetical protein n=1 Tax=unclassified Pseudonocardia TaxID=2619320 RepID=UPI000706375A|nr:MULTISPECIES: hypothetical protein [unclassified Pseudonocardia]ALL79382.1 hypothetical protein AD006_29315 [Pseudonocardia sp. EC080610-09]ALL85664.1 hypothetical protein AD017_31940 [Pseudonocardia sp. EC080619-01]